MAKDFEVDAIILAGGFGTRLQSVVTDVPKPMAPVNGRPFVEYIAVSLVRQGFKRLIFSVGYKKETIMNHFGREFMGADVIYACEDAPLGTGGGIKNAALKAKSDTLLILNGDTFFGMDYAHLLKFHSEKNSTLTIALKHMKKFDRYGTLETDAEMKVTSFIEKKYTESGNINTGTYVMDSRFLENSPDCAFSFEKFIEDNLIHTPVFGYVCDGTFIDIGIPEDYSAAGSLYELGGNRG